MQTMRSVNHHLPPSGSGPSGETLVAAQDGPDETGACRDYLLTTRDGRWTCRLLLEGRADGLPVSGISDEALLAVVVDRLHGRQQGPLATAWRAVALGLLEQSLRYLRDKRG